MIARWAGEFSHIRTVLRTPGPRPLISASASPRRLKPAPADTRERWASTPRLISQPAKRPAERLSDAEACSGRRPFRALTWLILPSIELEAWTREWEAEAEAGRAITTTTIKQTVNTREFRTPSSSLVGLRG